MNTLGLSTILRLGCMCAAETVDINGIKYNVIELLGQGGFSCVELIEHTTTKRKYALKRIKCHSIDDEQLAENEISYCKQLKHPNIIELIDACHKGAADSVIQSTSEAFLVLPYYKRGTLHDYLSLKSFSKTYLEIREIIRLFSGICQALNYMHNLRDGPIAHRDLKTGNVCLTDNLDPILMDLGSCAPGKIQICGQQDAQLLQDIAAERCSMTYRAPELFHVESYCVIDQRIDIWSLGCLLYALLYFKSPFDIVYERGDSVNLAMISGNVYFPVETVFSNVNNNFFDDEKPGEEIHNLIMFMLKINPSERPFIDQVIDRVDEYKRQLENTV